MTYVKCFWDECRSGEEGAWGCSWRYFEFATDGRVTRHIEMYDNGIRLRYGPDHMQDRFGGLAEASRQDMNMPDPMELSAVEFEAAWASVNPSVVDQ